MKIHSTSEAGRTLRDASPRSGGRSNGDGCNAAQFHVQLGKLTMPLPKQTLPQ